MRRLPPQNVEENLSKLLDIVDADLGDDLLSAIDQPLKVRRCKQTGKDYLACDYNRDGDSFRHVSELAVQSLSIMKLTFACFNRSPWSNEYDPELPDGATPNTTLRKLEVHANEAFDTYREMYYEGGVSSVYTFETEDKFAVVVLIKKGMTVFLFMISDYQCVR
jgi:capping protein beta